jgi:hypothetical protein
MNAKSGHLPSIKLCNKGNINITDYLSKHAVPQSSNKNRQHIEQGRGMPDTILFLKVFGMSE